MRIPRPTTHPARLSPAAIRQTLNRVLKSEEDLRKAEGKMATLVAAATK